MYESFFGFEKRAFPAVPDRSHFYPVEELIAARETLARVIQDGEGPAVVVGPAGVGKTLLCTMLEEKFRGDFHVVTLACGQLRELKDMLQSIVHQLRLPHQGQNEGELRLTLLDFLEPSEECPNGMLLLVDEAQHLSLELLEEVRMISNFVRNGSPRVRVVLLGNDRLEENFTNPKLESLNQRLAARCYLQGMGREETRQYISGLTTSAGGGLGMWSEDALRTAYDASNGIPRVVNQVCHNALMVAAQKQRTQVDGALIQEAWADLQQLPTPWNGDDPATEGTCVVEFGGLDEEHDSEPALEAPQTSVVERPPALANADEGVDVDFQELHADSATIETTSEATSELADEPTWDQVVVAQGLENTARESQGRAESHIQTRSQAVHYDLTPEAQMCGAEIQSRLAEVEECSGVTEPPLTAATTTVVSDPFGDFPEEEVVLEQHVQLGVSQRTVGPRVSSMESRLLAESLTIDTGVQPEEDPPNWSTTNDVVAFDGSRHEPPVEEPRQSYEPATVVPIFAATRDDRDMIVIDDDLPLSPESRGVIDRLRGK